MKLKKLEIRNFRCFESLALELDEQLTVLVARNGQGKTAVLDAVRIGLWAFVRGFDLARNPGNEGGNNISIDDVRMVKIPDGRMLRQLPCVVTLQGNFDLGVINNEDGKKLWTWSRRRISEAKTTKTKDNAPSLLIWRLATDAQNQVRNPESPDMDLPVIAYYGTGRVWSQKRLMENKKAKGKQDVSFYMRLFGYRDCLDSSSSFRHFADWFIWIFECYWEDKINKSEIGSSFETNLVWSNIIQVIQQVTNSVLHETGWHTLGYSVNSGEKSLVLKHDQYGALNIELLSDGIRNVLGIIGDIAYRCIKLNPHLGLNAAKESRGVVMIDEIDMHLHPEWQQTILGNLCKAFPKIQFIVTTHSPQVISTVPDHQIRILDGNQVYSAEAGTQGAESSRILKRIFGVDPRPQNDPNTKLLNDYLDLVYADKWDNAKTMRERLDAIYQGNEPALTEADLYIENRQWELDVEKN